MAEPIQSLLDLPLDILLLIFPCLDAKSFLTLCRTCKALYDPSIRFDASFWSHAVRTTFRVPNQPIIQHDGERWQKMYRRMLTQSRVYTWGSSGSNRLGHSHSPVFTDLRVRPFRSSHCNVPGEMDNTRQLGIIADMQCGGWSTTLLTSIGQLHTTGVLNGMRYDPNPAGSVQGPRPLQYPAGFRPPSTQYEEPSTSIRQFSSGRSHILGLSDSGRIWSWESVNEPALHVKFLDFDTLEVPLDVRPSRAIYGQVKKVVAGWSVSSAYIEGIGIVVWRPVQRTAQDLEIDTHLVTDASAVPKSAYRRSEGASRETAEERALGEEVGVIINHIVMEHFVVFITDIGKVFASRIDDNRVDDVMELRALRNDSGARFDVQGAFRSFAIFKNGEVITFNQTYLEDCWAVRHTSSDHSDISGLDHIPALQHNNVISLAFGDYHFLALHSTGMITAYGREPGGCGALGLGTDPGYLGATLRGVRHGNGENVLLPQAYRSGRQVWFEREKRDWLTFMVLGGSDPGESQERLDMIAQNSFVHGEVSEWFEQEGRDWDRDPELSDPNEDGLGSYFALSICAAGWHSGAIVLVNENLAERVRERCSVKNPKLPTLPGPGQSPGPGLSYVWADKQFPRLRLSNGMEMPGTKEFDEWKHGRPQWETQ